MGHGSYRASDWTKLKQSRGISSSSDRQPISRLWSTVAQPGISSRQLSMTLPKELSSVSMQMWKAL